MNIKPFGKRIYIKPVKPDTLIQTTAAPVIEQGTVLAVGPDCKTIKEGDTIFFTTWGVDIIEVDGEKLYFLMETDEFILARV